MAPDVPDKATRYALLPSPRSRCSSFPLTRTPVSIISILCLGKRVAQCVATSQFSGDRPYLPRRRLEANLPGLTHGDHPGWTPFEVNVFGWMRFSLNCQFFSDSRNPFRVIFLLRVANEPKILCFWNKGTPYIARVISLLRIRRDIYVLRFLYFLGQTVQLVSQIKRQ